MKIATQVRKMWIIALLGSTVIVTACSDDDSEVKATQTNIENVWDASQTIRSEGKNYRDTIYYHISSTGTWTAYDYMNDAYDGGIDPKKDGIVGDSRDCYLVTRLFNVTDLGDGKFRVNSGANNQYNITARIDTDTQIMRIDTPNKIYKHPLPKDENGNITEVKITEANHVKLNMLNACALT